MASMCIPSSTGCRGRSLGCPPAGLSYLPVLLILLLSLLVTCTHSLPLPGFRDSEVALSNDDVDKHPPFVDELWLQPVLVRRYDTTVQGEKTPITNTPTKELLNVGKILARLRRAMDVNRIKRKHTKTRDSQEMAVDARNERSGWDRSGWGGGYGK